MSAAKADPVQAAEPVKKCPVDHTAMSAAKPTISSGDIVVVEDQVYLVDGNKLLALERREEEEYVGVSSYRYHDFTPPKKVEDLAVQECVVISSDDVSLTQRQVADRTINPHAEDSEDVFIIPSSLLTQVKQE
jgi:hypothetical protein